MDAQRVWLLVQKAKAAGAALEEVNRLIRLARVGPKLSTPKPPTQTPPRPPPPPRAPSHHRHNPSLLLRTPNSTASDWHEDQLAADQPPNMGPHDVTLIFNLENVTRGCGTLFRDSQQQQARQIE